MRLKDRLQFILFKYLHFLKIKVISWYPFSLFLQIRYIRGRAQPEEMFDAGNKVFTRSGRARVVLFDSLEFGMPSFTLARELRQQQIPFTVCGWLPELQQIVRRENVSFIGISCFCTNIKAVREIIKQYYPSVPLVFGGPHALEYLDFGICCNKAGEEAVIQLYDYFAGRINRSQVNNIQYKENGVLKENTYKPVDFFLKAPVIHWPYLLLSRGCFHHCAFCGFSLSNRSGFDYYDLELKKINKTLDRYIKMCLKSRRLSIIVDTTVTPGHREVMEYLDKKGVGMFFNLRLEEAKDDFLEFLSRLKRSFVHIGIESMNQESLKAVNRQFNREIFLEKLKILQNNGLPVSFAFILGLPYQTKSDLEEDIAFTKLCKAEGKFYPLRLIHGTRLKEEQALHGYKTSFSGLVYESKYFTQRQYQEMFACVLEFYFSRHNQKISLRQSLHQDMYDGYEVIFNRRREL